MPMIDVTCATGTFPDGTAPVQELARTLARWEGLPEIPLFLDNTAAFVHELAPHLLSTASGGSRSVRITVLTPEGVLSREQKLGITRDMTDIVATAVGDPSIAQRTWVLFTESPDEGWGIGGYAYTRAELAAAAAAS